MTLSRISLALSLAFGASTALAAAADVAFAGPPGWSHLGQQSLDHRSGSALVNTRLGTRGGPLRRPHSRG